MDLPLSFSEELVWSATRNGSRAEPFLDCPMNMPFAVRFTGGLQADALARSLRDICDRHDVLRSRVCERDGGRAARVVMARDGCELAEIDLRGLPDDERAIAIDNLLQRERTRAFDLGGEPPMRATLATQNDEDHLLLLAVHHIAFDGWSKRVLADELKAHYRAHVSGTTPSAPPLEIAYADYVADQRRKIEGDRERRLVDHWAARLQGMTELRLPYDVERIGSAISGAHRQRLPPSTWPAVKSFSRRARTSPFVTLLALWKVFLHTLTNAADIVVGVPVSDRHLVEFEPLIGLFMNVLVIRTNLGGDPPFADVVRAVRDEFQDAYGDWDVPYGFLVKRLRAAGAAPTGDLFRVMFNFVRPEPGSAIQLPGVDAEAIRVPGDFACSADLSLHVQDGADEASCLFLYNANRFSSGRIQEFAEQFARLVSHAMANPDARISHHNVHA